MKSRMTSATSDVDGLLIVDKPAGMTSHDVVSRARRICSTRRVGHAGTLDPMATGVLVLGVNRGTRLLHFLVGADKSYSATIRLGVATTTEDAEGETVSIDQCAELDSTALAEAIQSLTGDIMQVPSAVSAIKVDGRRAYDRVRSGEEVVLPPRPVHIASFKSSKIAEVVLDSGETVTDIDVEVECSSGTYIRALARDLAAKFGVGGHLTALRRTRVGNYDLAQAQTLEDLEQGRELLSLADSARLLFPARELNADEVKNLGYGKWIARAVDDPSGTKEDPVAGYDEAGRLIALLQDAPDQYRPVVVFAPATQ